MFHRLMNNTITPPVFHEYGVMPEDFPLEYKELYYGPINIRFIHVGAANRETCKGRRHIYTVIWEDSEN